MTPTAEAIEYRVWIQIERYDSETDEYTEVNVPGFAASAVFTGERAEQQAQELAADLHAGAQSQTEMLALLKSLRAALRMGEKGVVVADLAKMAQAARQFSPQVRAIIAKAEGR